MIKPFVDIIVDSSCIHNEIKSSLWMRFWYLRAIVTALEFKNDFNKFIRIEIGEY